MSQRFTLFCASCNTEEQDALAQTCAKCHLPLELRYELPKLPRPTSFEPAPGMWQFKELLPVTGTETVVTLGEGHTPLAASPSEDLADLHYKVEYVNPTCSFKDRTASLLVTKAKAIGAKSVVIDSSGNAAAAISAYAARAGIACNVFVPQNTSLSKVRQMEAYGSQVFRVEGTRQFVLEAALKFAQEKGGYYCGFQLNPYSSEAYKTVAYEILMQDGVPDYVVLPMGTGGLLIGTAKGFEDMRRLGWTDKSPKVIGVQAEGCSPIVDAFSTGGGIVPVNDPHTVAEGLKIGSPYKGMVAVAKIKGSGGVAVSVTDEEILSAKDFLSRRCGLFVEPSGAVSAAGLQKLVKNGTIPGRSKVVCVLTGSGLKQQL